MLVISGVNEKTGGATDRNESQALAKNAEIYCDIVPEIVDAAPQAVLLVVTDPPDPLADIARKTRPGATVLSAGTYLMSTEAEETRPADSTSYIEKDKTTCRRHAIGARKQSREQP